MDTLDSSPEELNQDSAQAGQDVSQPADSSAADQGDKGPASMFDAVKAAIDKQGEDSPTSEEDQDGKTSPDKAGAPGQEADGESDDEGDDELSDEDLQRLNKRTQRRIKKLVATNREKDGQIADLAPRAQRFDQMSQYVAEAGLSSQEVTAGFNIMRMMKHEPEKALEALRPYVAELLKVTGALLPEDLQNEVRNGLITESRARELARSRAGAAITAQRDEQQRHEAVQQQHVAQWQQAISSISAAVSEVEKRWRSSDPDFAMKVADIQERMENLVLKGRVPRTPEDAVKLVQDIKRDVDKKFRRFMPAKQQVNPVSGQASLSAAPPPKTMVEAMQRAVGQ